MGIHHQDVPALRAAGDFDAEEVASEDKMQHISQRSNIASKQGPLLEWIAVCGEGGQAMGLGKTG